MKGGGAPDAGARKLRDVLWPVGPGARDQILHREEDLFPYFPLPRPNLVLATMWAMTDFTVDNGSQCLAGAPWSRYEGGTMSEARLAASPLRMSTARSP